MSLPTGEVQLIGTVANQYGLGDGSGLDGSVAAIFGSPPALNFQNCGCSPTGFVGIDLGSGNSAKVTEWRFCSCPSSTAYGVKEPYNAGAQLVGSASGLTTGNPITSPAVIDTIQGAREIIPGFKLTRRRVFPDWASGSPYYAYRSICITSPSYVLMSCIQFIADASSLVGSPTFMPVAPDIAPWGGNYPSGRVKVTITSITTSASIYYTTDGSTPTNTNGTLYTGSFMLEIGSGITLKAVAYDTNCPTTLSNVSSATFNPYSFKPRQDLIDQDGNLIRTQSGGILFAQGRYWRYGMPFWTSGGGGGDTTWYDGVHLESSLDMQNWIHHGKILDNYSVMNTSYFSIQRPHVRYCALTGLYVLYGHLFPDNRAGVAVSPTPMGPWRWVKWYEPDINSSPVVHGFKDCHFFVDPDTQIGYLLYTSAVNSSSGAANGYVYVSQLSPDYMTTIGTPIKLANIPSNYEGVAMFKRNGVFFAIAGAANYYDTQTVDVAPLYVAGTTIAAMSAASANLLFTSSQLGTNFNGQVTDVIPVAGQYILLSDYWPNTTGNNTTHQYDIFNSRDVTLPLTFPTSTTVQAQTPATWSLIVPDPKSGLINSWEIGNNGETLTIQ